MRSCGRTPSAEWFAIFAPILMNLSWTLLRDQCDTSLGRANRLRKFPRLYARTNRPRRTWFETNFVQESLVQVRAYGQMSGSCNRS